MKKGIIAVGVVLAATALGFGIQRKLAKRNA